MSASTRSLAVLGSLGVVVDIECRLSNNLPNIVIVGFANRAVHEARERIRGAFGTSRIMLPRKRITVNLAPADLPKEDSGFDLAIAVSILRASGQLPAGGVGVFIGELGLTGRTRGVRGIIGKLLAGRQRGLRQFYVPAANLPQAQLVPGVTLYPVQSLLELYDHLSGLRNIIPVKTGSGIYGKELSMPEYAVTLSEVAGQEQAKRALVIAAAGGHNLLLNGPPGTGKTMLAKALPSILPPLEQEEVLEVTQLHSLADHDYERLITARPFRAPHHSASLAAIIGGGHPMAPGAISLAHRGVLFCDELPEFSRHTLEALRQPLEDRRISLARAAQTMAYPANFILVATANPCPCGYAGVPAAAGGPCRCLPHQVEHYQKRLSGPILDRIDLHASVHEVAHEQLLKQRRNPAADRVVSQQIQRARQAQQQRFDASGKLNAAMTNRDIRRLARLSRAAEQLLNIAAPQMHLSARAYIRSVKVARTVADLDQSPDIKDEHLSEALAYRRLTSRE